MSLFTLVSINAGLGQDLARLKNVKKGEAKIAERIHTQIVHQPSVVSRSTILLSLGRGSGRNDCSTE